jgi:hypothetical protein
MMNINYRAKNMNKQSINTMYSQIKYIQLRFLIGIVFVMLSVDVSAKLETHPSHNADVIVCGGGSAGVAAAVSSARSGAHTVLIEQYGSLGGVLTTGLLSFIIDYENKTGIMKEICDSLKKTDAQVSVKTFDAERLKIIFDRMCRNAGVEIRLYTRLTAATVGKNGKISSIVTESLGGREVWHAKVYIDATGNGDLGAYAKCKFDVGEPGTGKTQPMSLTAIVVGVNVDSLVKRKFMVANGNSDEQARLNLNDEFIRAGIHSSYTHPLMLEVRKDMIVFSVNHEYGYSGIDAADLTKATLSAREEVNTIVDKLRSIGGIWANMRVVNTSGQIGIREGRRIHGLYMLTANDLIRGARFDDAVCRVTFCVDVHSLDKNAGGGYSQMSIRALPYDIPLRCLIAKDVDNMMMAGRCISGDFYAHASYRVIGNTVAMGEAAGNVAAQAAMKNLSLKKDLKKFVVKNSIKY